MEILDVDINYRTSEQAKCLGTDPALFFPDKGDHATATQAKLICKECVVRKDCLEYSVVHREKYGIWGGVGERERRKIIRSRNSQQ